MAEKRAQRKLAAILAADVAGYSRLVGADEEGTLAALTALRTDVFDPKIAEYGGRIANTAGDSILAEFPSIVEALRCSIDVQREVGDRNAQIPHQRRLEFRIGLNVGDVIDQDGDLLGDGVNVAARLEGLAEPGGINLSRSARDQVRDRLDVALEDLGEIAVKNIDRPVRIFRVRAAETEARDPAKTKRRRRIGVLIAILAVALTVGGTLVWTQHWATSVAPARPEKLAHPLPDKPSIAILPFANLSGGPMQDYLADGFVEDLITNVAQSKDLFVVARNSTFTYKGRAVKIQQVAEELGARYVLEGSIRRLGSKIRITTQLIDSSNGAHVWAKRYDRPATEIFDVQDELSREIAGTLLATINKADLAKTMQKRPSELSAHDYVLQARAKFGLKSEAGTLAARSLAQQAIAIDAKYAPAYAILGETYNTAFIFQWEGAKALDRAYEAARSAVELDPQLSTAHELLGRVLLRRRQHDEAIVSLKRSIALNPNRSDNYASLADAFTFANKSVEAIGLLKKAMRLDPFYSPRYNMYLGRAYYFSRQFDKAVGGLKTCAVRAPTYRPCYMYLAPAYAELNRKVDAKRAVETLLKISPGFAISTSVKEHLPFVEPAMDFYVSGLRKAGVPE